MNYSSKTLIKQSFKAVLNKGVFKYLVNKKY